MESLDGYSTAQQCVFGEVDNTHTTLAKFFDNSIMRNCLPDHGAGSPAIRNRNWEIGRCIRRMHGTKCLDDWRILRQMNEDFKVNFQNSVRQEFVRRRLLPLGEGCGDGVLSNKEKKTLLCAFFRARSDNKGERSVYGFRR